MQRRGCRPAQPFAVQPGLGQPGSSSLPQNLPFKLCEYRQKAGHRSTGWRSQVQRLGQRHKAHSEMLQFLKGCQQIRYRPAPAVQPPNQHDIDLATAGGPQQFSAAWCRSGRLRAVDAPSGAGPGYAGAPVATRSPRPAPASASGLDKPHRATRRWPVSTPEPRTTDATASNGCCGGAPE